jgi:hypothetical protein
MAAEPALALATAETATEMETVDCGAEPSAPTYEPDAVWSSC